MNTLASICAAYALVFTGCSAAILSVGTYEGSLVHEGSTRTSIHAAFGTPVEVEQLDPPVPIFQVLDGDRRTEALVHSVRDPRLDPSMSPAEGIISATLRESYTLKGRIERLYDMGGAIALAGYTAGLSELVMVPGSLLIQKERSEKTHKVTVWYDGSGRALAYLWREFGADGKPNPDVPERLHQAPKVERVFDQPEEIVAIAARIALQKHGFENKGPEVPGFIIGWRPYVAGSSGGESLNVWIRRITPERTMVVVCTVLNATGIEHQRLWNSEILDAIGDEL